MDQKHYDILAQIRLDDAKNLLADAEILLKNNSYKSANNRAFYAAEKAVKALLAHRGKSANTHSACLTVFNIEYIHGGDGFFTKEDYRLLSSMERIRSVSDYDDFYIANKAESTEQISNARSFIERASAYLDQDFS